MDAIASNRGLAGIPAHMSELQRSVDLPMALSGSLLILSIGPAAAVEVPRPDWVLLIVGAALFVLTVIPLAVSRRPGYRRAGLGVAIVLLGAVAMGRFTASGTRDAQDPSGPAIRDTPRPAG